MKITKNSDSVLVLFFKLYLCTSTFVACILFGFQVSPSLLPFPMVVIISFASTILFAYWIFGIFKLKNKQV